MMHRRTKIVATLGPSSSSPQAIAQLAQAGVNVFRLNLSHGSHAEHQARFQAIRQAEAHVGCPLGVLLDLQGPKIRVGRIPGGPRQLAVGDTLVFDADPPPSDPLAIPFPHPDILNELEVGHILMVDDGKLHLQVQSLAPGRSTLQVQVGGVLSDRKGVNLPSTRLSMSALTPKDREDLAFGLALGVDWVALSFVQHAQDIEQLRELVGTRVGIIAKLEKPSAMLHLEAIAQAADALMVARGDLGVEVPPEDVPGLQRRIIAVARRLGRPVVVATQMLESMIAAPTPTRAEASDVATAVYLGADAVMLSAETAAGSYPVQAVEMMARIVSRAERDALDQPAASAALTSATAPLASRADAMGVALRAVCAVQPLAAAVTYTTSGASALCVARERPATTLIGLTPHARTARKLCLVWGVIPVVAAQADSVEDMIDNAVSAATSMNVPLGDLPLAVVAGLPFATPGSTNMLRLVWPPVQT
jgi:pyruvate kinase